MVAAEDNTGRTGETELNEELLEPHEVFEGHLITMHNDEVKLPNGDTSHREYVTHPGGACVCAVDSDMNVTLVRQFRYAYGKTVLELPAGKIENGENPVETAKRELREETGLIADELLPLGEMYPSPGYTNEIIYMYLAIHFREAEQDLDKDEFVNVVKMPFSEAIGEVMQGELLDGKSQIAILKTYMVLSELNQLAEQVMAADAESSPEV